MLVSLPYSHFMGGMKWSISCHINKPVISICDSGLPKCEFLGLIGKKQKDTGHCTIYNTKKSKILQSFKGRLGQVILSEAGHYVFYNNKSGKIRVKVTEADPV